MICRRREEEINRLFGDTNEVANEEYSINKCMVACFVVCSSEEIPLDGEQSDDDLIVKPGRIYLKHKQSDIDVRRTIIDFGRCFGFGSIPRGALRKTESVNAANSKCSALKSFSECSHTQSVTISLNCSETYYELE